MYCPNPRCPDRLANGVPGEYREGTERCPYCGEPLLPGPPPPPEGAPDVAEGEAHRGPGGAPAAREVTLLVAGDPTEASMITGLLEEHGIACMTRVEGLHGEPAFFSARWAPLPGQRYEIVVSSASEAAARRLLEDAMGPEAPSGPARQTEPTGTALSGGGPGAGQRIPLRLLLLMALMLASLAAAVYEWFH